MIVRVFHPPEGPLSTQTIGIAFVLTVFQGRKFSLLDIFGQVVPVVSNAGTEFRQDALPEDIRMQKKLIASLRDMSVYVDPRCPVRDPLP